MKFGILVCGVLIVAPTFLFATTESFQRALSLGMRGSDVREMQKVLNRDNATRITDIGSGSPGNETDYFGYATKRALIKFQEKYASEVLVPAGLARGNGYAGSYTRAKLNTLSVMAVGAGSGSVSVASLPIVPGVASSSPTTSPRPISISTATTSQNPNLENIDLYINKIKQDGIKQGVSSSTLLLIENNIRKGAATTTDFRKQFFDNQKAIYEKKISGNTPSSPWLAFFGKVASAFGVAFSPEKAYAALGLPFGGYIVYVNPVICNCPTPGLITHVFIASPNPNPIQSNLLLTYVNGSELFSWYNIPLPGIAVLGEYIPAVQSCWTWIPAIPPFCAPVPSEGQISPIVGSSLAPL